MGAEKRECFTLDSNTQAVKSKGIFKKVGNCTVYKEIKQKLSSLSTIINRKKFQ